MSRLFCDHSPTGVVSSCLFFRGEPGHLVDAAAQELDAVDEAGLRPQGLALLHGALARSRLHLDALALARLLAGLDRELDRQRPAEEERDLIAEPHPLALLAEEEREDDRVGAAQGLQELGAQHALEALGPHLVDGRLQALDVVGAVAQPVVERERRLLDHPHHDVAGSTTGHRVLRHHLDRAEDAEPVELAFGGREQIHAQRLSGGQAEPAADDPLADAVVAGDRDLTDQRRVALDHAEDQLERARLDAAHAAAHGGLGEPALAVELADLAARLAIVGERERLAAGRSGSALRARRTTGSRAPGKSIDSTVYGSPSFTSTSMCSRRDSGS